MKVGVESLIAPGTAAYAEEAREFRRGKAAMEAEGPDFDLRTPEGLRGMRESLSHRPVPHGPQPEEVIAEAGGRQVPVRVLRPQSGDARGVYLDIHGGGFYMGWAARNDAKNRRLADACGVAVVSVDYRLAPEDPWPAAPDDCETAALWLLEVAEERFGTARLAIGGASAGGNLAMTALLRLRDKGLAEPFVATAIQYGAFDLSGITPAGRIIADEFFLEAYVGEIDDCTYPDISPNFGDLHDLPPTLILVGTEDILLEDNLTMAARLAAAGTDVDVRAYPESPHGFTSFPIAMAEAATRDMEEWLAAWF